MDVIANGIRIGYVESGSGYPVVCIPGNGLTMDTFRHLLPHLSQRYRTIAYDPRGMGISETVGKRGVTASIEDHGRDLEAFLDALGIDRAAIVAHAFGSFVAMQVAIERPQRISVMVAANPSAKVSSTTAAPTRWASTVEEQGMAPIVEEAMTRWFLDEVHRDRPEVIQRYREMYANNPPMGYAANCRGIAQLDLRPGLSKIQCPTLLLAGEKDRSTPPEDSKIIADAMPNARLVVVPNTSHTVPEEQAEEFNRMTLEFLAQNISA